jgi:hypothetical protein
VTVSVSPLVCLWVKLEAVLHSSGDIDCFFFFINQSQGKVILRV